MRIEVLTFAGCPNAATTRDFVRQALNLEAVDAEIDYISVETAEFAQSQRFLGSPSVRVDGEDVELSANERTAFGLMCRTYGHGAEAAGSPSVAMIRSAIRRRIGVSRRPP
jgi:hypothetical protein